MNEKYPEDRPVLAHIGELLVRARATQTPVIYVQHDGGKGHPLEVGTPGWQINAAIAPQSSEPIVRKQASDSFYKTALQRELEARGITHLVVAGAMTEQCVDTTCRRALSEGYDVTLAADAHTTADTDMLTTSQIVVHTNATLANLTHPDHSIIVKPTDEIVFAAPDEGETQVERTMSNAELIAKLRTERAAWDALLTEVGEVRMTEPGVVGEWSVKDIVAHVSAYEQWTAEQLEASLRGETKPVTPGYFPPEANTSDIDERNEVIYRVNHDRALTDVLADARAAYSQLLAAVERLADADVSETHRFGWTSGKPLWEVIAGDSYDHYAEHMPDIRTWLAGAAK